MKKPESFKCVKLVFDKACIVGFSFGMLFLIIAHQAVHGHKQKTTYK